MRASGHRLSTNCSPGTARGDITCIYCISSTCHPDSEHHKFEMIISTSLQAYIEMKEHHTLASRLHGPNSMK
jgi:hypothetical protein